MYRSLSSKNKDLDLKYMSSEGTVKELKTYKEQFERRYGEMA
jgi:hypothetical protein